MGKIYAADDPQLGRTTYRDRKRFWWSLSVVYPLLPFTGMAVTYFLMIFTILPLARYMSRVTVVRTVYMAPIVIAFTLVGAFVSRDYVFDMFLALAFGVLIVALIVAGSLWIMAHLNHNMLPMSELMRMQR